MRCPFCGHLEDKVVDSRQSKDGAAIRRRRECLDCGRRFTSYEHIEEVFPQIVKRDGTREDYDRQKIVQGVRIACKKLPISRIQIDAVVDEVEELVFLAALAPEGLHIDQPPVFQPEAGDVDGI